MISRRLAMMHSGSKMAFSIKGHQRELTCINRSTHLDLISYLWKNSAGNFLKRL